MRIVAGKYRHRLINYPDDQEHTRPTKDRIREAFFNALGDINGFVVLDLYAGSGSLGLEALSRGASFCYFVDISKLAISTIKENVSNLGILKEEYTILNSKDVDAISQINKKLDLVLLDPPYKQGKYEEIISLLEDKLNKNAVIVCESDHSLNINSNNYKLIKEYKYGEIYITIMWR